MGDIPPQDCERLKEFPADFGVSRHPEFNFDAPKAAVLRDEGIARAENKTERGDPGWKDRAMDFLNLYRPPGAFMAEQFREWAYSQGLSKPASERCWGGVFQRASREGLLQQAGFGVLQTPGQHKCPGRLWRKTL
jgi:hypothetical protein